MHSPLETLLSPDVEPLPARTGEPVELGQEPSPPRTAVIICHGMGQQVRFQTLNDVVQAMRNEAFRRGHAVRDVVTRLVLFRDAAGSCTETLGRAEITLGAPGVPDRVVHLYEAYWAPLTEGKVVLRDVMWFLLLAGWNGIVGGLRGFRRLMFGTWVELSKTAGTTAIFLFAIAVIAALMVVNAAVGLVVAGNLLKNAGTVAWPNPILVNALIRDLALVEAVAVPLAVVMLGLHAHRSRFLLRNRMTDRRWRVPRVVELALAAWVWLALSAAIAGAVLIVWHGLELRTASGDASAHVPTFAVVAGTALVLSYIGRRFLIQYVGDVVIYISSHAVSRFAEIRTEIQRVGIAVGRAVYGAPQYDRCILVGHSLGSVVAYDLYNRMLNEGSAAGWQVRARTPLLLTFGSPLDKTAFVFRTQGSKEADVREALAAAMQPIIVDGANRPARWVNIWSRRDWISGPLEYYERPGDSYVENVADPEATLPLIAHTQYWDNLELARRLYDGIMG